MGKRYLFLILFIIMNYSIIYGQSLIIEENRLVEIPLLSTIDYNDPVMDIDITCKLTYQDGTFFSVNGFWDGERSFKARFSLPKQGKWSFLITCSDSSNKGLHNISGEILVNKYQGENPFYKKGFPIVSENGRYLTYGDGAPLFYLGESIWEIYWKSTKDGFLKYLKDRKNKEFNCIQTITMSHYRLWNYGVMNRNSQPAFLENDFSKINPRYFDYMDYVIQTANDSGMIIALMPVHASMVILHKSGDRWIKYFSVEESFRLAKYLGSRYSGFNIIWINAGDQAYNTQEIRNFWDNFGRIIKKASGGRQLMTLHPQGLNCSSDCFDNNTDWLDFHMFQSAHWRNADYNYKCPLKEFMLQPPKPVIGGELCYEDFHDSVWTMAPRLTSYDVRQAIFESILSGAIVGATYGCNGVFQWEDPVLLPDVPIFYDARYFFEAGWKMPGSSNITVLRKLFERYNWYNLWPNQELLSAFSSNRNHICVAEGPDKIITYTPRNTKYINLDIRKFDTQIKCTLIDPETGDSSITYPNSAINYLINIPDDKDYFIVVTNNDNYFNFSPPTSFLVNPNYPNPFNSTTNINFNLPFNCKVSINIYNSLGQEVYSALDKEQEAGQYTFNWTPENIASGVYFLKFQAEKYSKILKMVYLR